MRTQPGAVVRRRSARHSLDGDDTPVADLAREARRVRSEQTGADGRVDTVSTNNRVGLDFGAVPELRPGDVAVGVHLYAAGTEGYHLFGQTRREHVQQIGAVHAATGRAVALLRFGPGVLRDHSSTLPAEQVLIIALVTDVANGLLQAKYTQRLHGVRPEGDPGADFFQLRLRLVNVDVEAFLQERMSRRATPDPSAYHGDSCLACHPTRDCMTDGRGTKIGREVNRSEE